MKRKLIIGLCLALALVACAGLEFNVNRQNLLTTTLETGAFLLGNIGAKQNPIAFHAAAEIAKRAMEQPAWSLAFTEHTLNEMWAEVMPFLSTDPAMTHLAKKWLTVLQYNSEQKYVIVPPEYAELVKSGISEFLLGVQMTRGL